MRTLLVSPLLLALLPLLAAAPVGEPDIRDTRLLSQPAVSAKHIAFVYADDLWVADLDGKQRPPAHQRHRRRVAARSSRPTARPSPSPPSTTATSTSTPSRSRAARPTRLTWHPGPDVVRGFTPDGKAVLFSSPRHVSNNRHTQLFTVPLTGGMPTQLPDPLRRRGELLARRRAHRLHAARRPHAAVEALPRRHPLAHLDLPHARTTPSTQIPQPEGRCNDLDPQLGRRHRLLPLRPRRRVQPVRLRRGAQEGQAADQVHRLPRRRPRRRRRQLIFEQAGYLHLFDPGEARAEAAEGRRRRPTWSRPGRATSRGRSTSATRDVSPSGARAVFEFRGEIVTVPAEKGDPRNLTELAGVHERVPAWSPDGKSVAYFSDEGGEYQLHVRAADGKGEAKAYDARAGPASTSGRRGRRTRKKIAFVDNSQSLFWIDLDGGKVKKIASEPHYGPSALLAAAAGLVAGLEVDRLHPGQQGRLPHRLRLRRWPRASRGRSPTA